MEPEASAPAVHDQFFPSSIAHGASLPEGSDFPSPEEHFAVRPQRPKSESRAGHERAGTAIAGPRSLPACRGVDRVFPLQGEEVRNPRHDRQHRNEPTKASQTLRIMRRCPRSVSVVVPADEGRSGSIDGPSEVIA